jgi:uncharacterized protein (TIGR03086 family)
VSDPAERFRRRAAGFTEKVEAVPDDRWESPSPCPGWTARDVVRHMIDNCTRFLGLVGIDPPPGPTVDTDPVGAWAAARDAMQASLDDPSVASREYEGRLGRSTLGDAVDRFMGTDLVVHAWDLARATGIDETLDPTGVRDADAAMRPLGDAIRSPGTFGPEVPAPPGADEQTRLLAFLGRRV